jgi:fumarate reductase subunit C
MTDGVTKTKEYIRPMPTNWWLKRKSYFMFMVRELTCLFVCGYAIFLLMLASRLGDLDAFTALLKDPIVIALQVIALPMVVYHTVTWLNLTPKVLVIWRGENRVNPLLIAAAHYLAWFAVSAVILWIVSMYR